MSERGTTRQAIGLALNEEQTVKKIHKLIDNVMKLNGTEWGYCPDCRKKVQVEVADLKGRVDALIKLLEQAEGKPQDAQSSGMTLIVERTWPVAGTSYSDELHPARAPGSISPVQS